MKFRFRKRIKIAPGIRLNISKSGVSTSVGRRGASVNLGKQGTRVSVGVPGSGISSSKLYKRKPKNKKNPVPNHATAQTALATATGSSNKLKVLGWILALFFLTAALKSYFTTDESSDTQPPINNETKLTTQKTAHADKGKAPTLTVKTLYVAPPTLNIRNTPNGKIIGTINQGVPVVIYQEQDGWSRISADNDTEKWVANQYLCAEQDCEHF